VAAGQGVIPRAAVESFRTSGPVRYRREYQRPYRCSSSRRHGSGRATNSPSRTTSSPRATSPATPSCPGRRPAATTSSSATRPKVTRGDVLPQRLLEDLADGGAWQRVDDFDPFRPFVLGQTVLLQVLPEYGEGRRLVTGGRHQVGAGPLAESLVRH